MTTNTSNYKIGKNIASHRFVTLDNEISLDDLNEKTSTFKIEMNGHKI